MVDAIKFLGMITYIGVLANIICSYVLTRKMNEVSKALDKIAEAVKSLQ